MQVAPADLALSRRNDRASFASLAERVIAVALLAVIGNVGSGVAQPTFTPIRTLTPLPSAVAIDVGKGAGAPGQTTLVRIGLQTMGAEVVSTQNRIDFLPSVQIASRAGNPDCIVNSQIDKQDSTFRFLPVGCLPGATCTAMQASVLSLQNVTPIPSGILYTCQVTISEDAAAGIYPLSNSGFAASDSRGRLLSVTGSDGAVTVRPTPVAIDVEDIHSPPGVDAVVSVRLMTGGADVVGTQNRIAFASPVHILARATGDPDCSVNPVIDKNNTAFRFLPIGCSESECMSVRALVLSFSNRTPIPDGATLYTCRVLVDMNAEPGVYLLRNSEQRGTTPDAVDLPAIGRDGRVTVDEVQSSVAIEIGTVRTIGGGRPTVEVSLDVLQHDAPPVAGTQNEILFDPMTPIAAGIGGQPDCRVDASINKNDTGFVFLPPHCTPEATCTGIRAFVFAADNTDPIPDGSVLYRCTVHVADDAPVGSYVLQNADVAASDPAGEPVDARAESGEVEVICAGDCDANGKVAIFELLRGVNMLLGSASLSACPIFDIDGSETVQVNEIILAVSSALNGCTLTN